MGHKIIYAVGWGGQWAGMGLMTTSFMVVAKGGICGEDICYKRLR